MSLRLTTALVGLSAALFALVLYGAAHAARPDTDHCRAPLPRKGATFAGIVHWVGDGALPFPVERRSA